MKRELKGCILINAFSRAESLASSLESIVLANIATDVPIFVVFQTGSTEVEAVLFCFREKIAEIIQVDGTGKSALENINSNRITGYTHLFDKLRMDWVLAIEEDVLIARDTLNFVEFIMNKYWNVRAFKGINLGSREPLQTSLLDTYSKLRFGLNGQASAVTSKTWKGFNLRRITRKIAQNGFDSMIENNLRRGFMITPNLSRSLDIGWDGTHQSSNPEDPYFVEMRESFVSGVLRTDAVYREININHRWREDIEIYRRYRTLESILRRMKLQLKHKIKLLLVSKVN